MEFSVYPLKIMRGNIFLLQMNDFRWIEIIEREVLLMRSLRFPFITGTFLLLIALIAFAWLAHAQYAVHASSSKIHSSPSNCGNWNVVPNPAPNNTYTDLFGVNALSTTDAWAVGEYYGSSACLLYTSPSPRDGLLSRMPSSA